MKLSATTLARALLAALIAGILVAWSPLYWPFAVSIVGICAVGLLWAAFQGGLAPVPELALAIPIGAWGFLQLAAGTSLVPAMTLRAALTWAVCAVAFLLGSAALRHREARAQFLRGLMWALAVLAAEALLQYFIPPHRVFGIFEASESVVGTVFYRNQFAALMEVGGAVALWQIVEGRPVVGALCFSVMFSAVVATASRAGSALMVLEALTFAAIALLRRGRSGVPRFAGLTLVGFAILASGIVGTDSLRDKFRDGDYFAVRRELRASTLRMIPAAPLLGNGLGTWRAVYPRYATLDMALVANEAHNDWLQWAADGGIPFAALIFLFGALAGSAAAGEVWGIGLIAVMVHCLVDYPMRTPAVSFLWFTLAGAACALRHNTPAKDRYFRKFRRGTLADKRI